ncbi:hypothetical protein Cs7R123_09770 [Catellatospora sp. TT07R-123]|uniref:hypothetical protein n=1 Tax=Catellatospora sp. TT07R-123 TaxID=2733863 RepID=UPI001B213AF7|nr:hypothetical protein [Catellatospora sp. TT07R-123]GHJ43635.1 hypothetical protein Cs7R123_09770 [Catellatospora sp. TT07R-123]
MNQGEDPRWPYLSPSFVAWDWVPEPRAGLRRLLLPATAAHARPLARTNAVLDVLEGLDAAMRAMEDDALLLITEAYRRGASWAQIAGRLGRSKQTVHQRYQNRVGAAQTEKLLLADLAHAHGKARRIYEHGGSPDDRARATAFLRRHPRPRQSRRPGAGGSQ